MLEKKPVNWSWANLIKIKTQTTTYKLDIHNNRRECSMFSNLKANRENKNSRREFMRALWVYSVRGSRWHWIISSWSTHLSPLTCRTSKPLLVTRNMQTKKDENPPTHWEDGDAGRKNTCEIWRDAQDEEKSHFFLLKSHLKVEWVSETFEQNT